MDKHSLLTLENEDLTERDVATAKTKRYASDITNFSVGRRVLVTFDSNIQEDIASSKLYAETLVSGGSLPPCIFSLTTNAYMAMKEEKEDQAILIT